jgi:hypothetical protein
MNRALGRLIWPAGWVSIEVGGPSSESVTDLGRLTSVITEKISRSLGPLAAPPQ